MRGKQVLGVFLLAFPFAAVTVFGITQGNLRQVLSFWGTVAVVLPIVMLGLHLLLPGSVQQRLP
jgi:hypothetical protein